MKLRPLLLFSGIYGCGWWAGFDPGTSIWPALVAACIAGLLSSPGQDQHPPVMQLDPGDECPCPGCQGGEGLR